MTRCSDTTEKLSGSERRLRVIALAAVAATALATLAFHWLQNRLALTGGGIAWAKSVWLGCAVLYWYVLPALLVGDMRLAPVWRRAFACLLALMTLRALVELWMLYVSHNWSPFYGIAHDAWCFIVMGWFAIRAAVDPRLSQHTRLRKTMRLHAVVTGLLFVPEMAFAWYMQAHFATAGDHPVYFVPAGPAHGGVLTLTAAAAAAALLYLPGFLYAWLNLETAVDR